MTQHQAQTFTATGEHYYCVEQSVESKSSFGLHGVDLSELYATRVGDESHTVTLDGHTLVEYRFKHKEATGSITSMLVHEATGYPYRMLVYIYNATDLDSWQE